MKKRVLWVGPSNLGPYHLARYNSLVEQGWEVHVLACPVAEHFRPWKFDESSARFRIHLFPPENKNNLLLMKKTASELIDSIQPSVAVFVGYASSVINMVALECRLRKVPRLLNIIGNPSKFTPNRGLLKARVKGVICSVLYPAALVPGSRGRALGSALGIGDSRIWEVGNVIDVSHFWNESVSPCEKPYFLYVGRLSPEKNLERLIEAYANYRHAGGDWDLAIVGDGPARSELLQMSDAVPGLRLPGWVDYRELPELLQSCGAFVLPSLYEPWGLVLNEAMAAGAPLIVSRNCGAYPELCRDGTNGFGVNPMSTQNITDALHQMTSLSSQDRTSMGLAGQKIVSSYTWSEWTTGVSNALQLEYQRQGSTGGKNPW